MGEYVGADWAGKGWLTVSLAEEDGGRPRPEFYASILNLWLDHREADRILIDIPIGLPEDKTRRCDDQAKQLMGPRHGSVYTVPVRDAVYQRTYREAREVQEQTAQIGLSTQSWGIVPRIREVDVFLRHYDQAREQIRETHPELCFLALKGDRLQTGKSDPEGEKERRRILKPNFQGPYQPLGDFLSRLRKNNTNPIVSGAVHDILDAMVAAYTATLSEGDRTVLPLEEDETDREELPMEIVVPRLPEELVESLLAE